MSEREVNELFAKNLTRLLEEHDLSQAQFGSIIGVTQQAVSRWMSARVFPVAYLLIFKGFCKQCVSSRIFVSSKKYLPSRCHGVRFHDTDRGGSLSDNEGKKVGKTPRYRHLMYLAEENPQPSL